MSTYTTDVKTTAKRSVKYRYICENCGYETEWYNQDIIQQTNETYGGRVNLSVSAEEEKKEIVEKALVKRIEEIKTTIETGKPIFYYFGKGESCPKCKKPQSWFDYSSELEKVPPNLAGIGCLFSILIAFLGFVPMMICTIAGFDNNDWAGVFCVLGIVAAIVFSIIYMIRKSKKYKSESKRVYDEYISSLPKRNKPEIDWDSN